MVMIHVKGRIYQEREVKRAGSQHLHLGRKRNIRMRGPVRSGQERR